MSHVYRSADDKIVVVFSPIFVGGTEFFRTMQVVRIVSGDVSINTLEHRDVITMILDLEDEGFTECRS